MAMGIETRSRTFDLPKEKKAKILTTETDEWMPFIAEVLLEGKKACILPCGGPYVIAGGVFANRADDSIGVLINTQKQRETTAKVALGIPPSEMALWVDGRYQDSINKVITALEGTGFGLIAPCNDGIPVWLRSYDSIHRVHEKLMVWGDGRYRSPITKFFKYLRENLKILPDEFFLVATSANLHGRRGNTRFSSVYEQLGDKEGLVYAVKDVEEDTYEKGSPPIIYTLPVTRGRERFWVFRENGDIKDLKVKLPEVEVKSRLGIMLYSAEVSIDRAKRFFFRDSS